jgi:hypothetical protein
MLRAMGGQNDAALEALWKHVLHNWDDEAAHSAFIDFCRQSERLVEAAVRYRGMSADRTRRESAEKKLKAVALLAMTALEASRTPADARGPQLLGYVLVAFFVAATIGLLAYLGVPR